MNAYNQLQKLAALVNEGLEFAKSLGGPEKLAAIEPWNFVKLTGSKYDDEREDTAPTARDMVLASNSEIVVAADKQNVAFYQFLRLQSVKDYAEQSPGGFIDLVGNLIPRLAPEHQLYALSQFLNQPAVGRYCEKLKHSDDKDPLPAMVEMLDHTVRGQAVYAMLNQRYMKKVANSPTMAFAYYRASGSDGGYAGQVLLQRSDTDYNAREHYSGARPSHIVEYVAEAICGQVGRHGTLVLVRTEPARGQQHDYACVRTIGQLNDHWSKSQAEALKAFEDYDNCFSSNRQVYNIHAGRAEEVTKTTIQSRQKLNRLLRATAKAVTGNVLADKARRTALLTAARTIGRGRHAEVRRFPRMGYGDGFGGAL